MATPAQPVDLEPYQQELSGALFAALVGPGAELVGYIWENGSNIGIIEAIGLSLTVAVVVYIILYIPQLLPRAFGNKLYTVLAVFMCFLLFASLSRLRSTPTVVDTTKSTDSVPEKAKHTEQALNVEDVVNNKLPLTGEGTDSVKVTRLQVDDNIPTQNVKQNSGVHSASATNGPIPARTTFNGDCTEHAKWLISQPHLVVYLDRYHIEGQVDMFGRTILLKGKPSYLALSDDYNGPYEGEAIDVMNRHHNRECSSSVSAKDAVEKALVNICLTLKQKGLQKYT